MISTISIKNSRILEVVAREWQAGAGRSMTEAAENMIQAEAERRYVERAAAKAGVSGGKKTDKAEASHAA